VVLVVNARFGVLVVVALVVTSCSGDDNADPTAASTPVTTVPATAAPTTVAVPSTLPPTTSTLAATSSTLDPGEALKAEVAAAFVRTEQLREDLSRAPTLDGLEDKLAMIAVPGSPTYIVYLDFFQGLVERGERVVPGTPDSSEVRVESVEFVGDPSDGQAVVTACDVTNEARVGPDGSVIEGSGGLLAARIKVPMQRTDSRWLQTGEATRVSIQREVTECSPS
jgi:hypothetical protein